MHSSTIYITKLDCLQRNSTYQLTPFRTGTDQTLLGDCKDEKKKGSSKSSLHKKTNVEEDIKISQKNPFKNIMHISTYWLPRINQRNTDCLAYPLKNHFEVIFQNSPTSVFIETYDQHSDYPLPVVLVGGEKSSVCFDISCPWNSSIIWKQNNYQKSYNNKNFDAVRADLHLTRH